VRVHCCATHLAWGDNEQQGWSPEAWDAAPQVAALYVSLPSLSADAAPGALDAGLMAQLHLHLDEEQRVLRQQPLVVFLDSLAQMGAAARHPRIAMYVMGFQEMGLARSGRSRRWQCPGRSPMAWPGLGTASG
jgi:hypothetical protein